MMRLLRRLARWWRFRAHEEELVEELAFHRAAIEQELIERGSSPSEARDAARRAMGNEMLQRENARGVWLWPRLEAVVQDARAALRGLRRSPAFTAGVILTFALGVGANAAMFSLLDRLMLRPPALMRDPGTVHRVYLYRTREGVESPTGGQYARHADLVRETRAFSAVAGHATRELAVGVGQEARERRVAIVSANFFDFFDAPPAAGRYFRPDEDAPPEGARVAVLSHSGWQAIYGGRQGVIGSALQVGAVVYTIIGIAPEGFVGLWPLRPPVAFIPLATYAQSRVGSAWTTTYSSAFGLEAIVRRRPGISMAAASEDLTRALRQSYRIQSRAEGWDADARFAQLRPRAVAGSILLERGPERSSVARVATWLGGVTVVVLLIACANVASLLLARALSRRREIAVRLALGVSRARLLSQLLTESMLLALGGGALGLLVAVWLSALLRAAFLPHTDPPPVAGDLRTVGFLFLITLFVGMVTGILPALQARKLALTDDLKSSARSGTYRRSRARAALLVMQGALSLVLLIGAGLFVRSLRNVRAVPLGFDADSVLIISQEMRDTRLDSAGLAALRRRLLAAATTVPGITHATLRLATPFGGMTSYALYVEGIDSVDRLGSFETNAVSPGYFATMGTRLLRGRGIEASDVEGARPVMVVGASMAAVLWPREDALGKCVRVRERTNPCTWVVGIADDIHARGFEPQERKFYYYLAADQWLPNVGGLFARAAGDPALYVEPLRQRLQREMPGSSYVTVTPLGRLIENESRSWRMGAILFTAFGALALVLAAVGLYSVIAYDVAQRRHELAVRVALGARSGAVIRLVLLDGMRYALAGALGGAVLALVLGRWIQPLLFNASARDPAVFGTVAALLLAVSASASLVPALRAAGIDPGSALRTE